MTPLTLLVLAGLAVLLAFLVRRRRREATARPPVASHPSGDGRPRGVDENVQFTVYRP
jgi:LPXTG-motif cell wall-anchored protein